MKQFFFAGMLLISLPLLSQPFHKKSNAGYQGVEKYISLNFLSMAEPHFALGPSAGIRFSERSEVFAEAAYVGRGFTGTYSDLDRLSGARLIFQYRYHFLQQWRPLINLGMRSRSLRERHQPFVALEWRMKPLAFSGKATFVNESTADTLSGFSYRASSFTIGGALVFGSTFNLSSNERWKLEITAGIGAKQRSVKLKNVPAGYQSYSAVKREWLYIPPPEVETSGVLLPIAIRLRYVLD